MPVVNYLWNPLNDNIVREFDDSGTVIAEYTTEANQFGNVVSQRRNGQDSVYHYDGQGSTLALTSSNGAVTDTYSYSAFGEVTAQTGSTVNPFQYIGQKQYYRDAETDEYNVRRRPYSAKHARWLSCDPVRIPLIHTYVYANANPIQFIDPSGEICYSTDDFPAKSSFGCKDELLGKTAFRWSVEWKPGPTDNGFIIQKMVRSTTIYNCVTGEKQVSQQCPDPDLILPAGTPGQSQPTIYWELWFVQKGTVVTSCVGPKGFASDSWALGDLTDTRGWDDVQGNAHFISSKDVDPCTIPLPGGDGIWAVDPTSPARELHFSCDVKGLVVGRPFASRRIVTSWCCCKSVPDGQESGITIARFDSWGRCP